MRSLLAATACAAMLMACGQPAEAPPAPAGEPAGSAAPAAVADGPDIAEMQAAVAALPAPYNAASYENGQRVFAQCRSCHTIGAGEPNRVGPNLHGIFGREIGSVQGFTYSNAVQEANFAWDPAQLENWLANPQSFLPGNRMAFAGVRDETQRRDIIAYLLIETAAE